MSNDVDDVTTGATAVGTGRRDPAPRRAGSRPRRETLVTFGWAFLALLVVFTAWGLANPMTAAPDEPAHATKAAGVVHGQPVGESFDPARPSFGHVDIPGIVAHTEQMPRCFAFQPQVTASCTPAPPADVDATVEALTTASTYNPGYYAVVGLPSLAPTGLETLYLMRFLASVLCALALAWAFTQALTVRGGQWIALGVLVSLTPMVVYLSSAINPASLEIALAAALWVSLTVVIRDDDPTRLRSRMAAIGIIAAVLVNLRGLSPLFLAIVVLASVASAPWPWTWRVLRRPATWPWVGLVAVASVVALAWTRSVGPLDSDGVVRHPTLVFWTAVQWSLGDTSVYVANMLGQFGWVDTNLPTWLLMVVAGTIGPLVLAGFALATARQRAVMVVLGVLTIVLPVVIHSSQALYWGIVWQGRYFLPAAVGLPILAATALATSLRDAPARLGRRAVALVGTSWVTYQVLAFLVNLHRYRRGMDAGWFEPVPDLWSPPVPASLLTAALVAGLAALVGLCAVGARRDARAAASAGPPDGPPGADDRVLAAR